MNKTLGGLLRRAAAQQRIAVERALSALDLTPAQFAILRIVAESPGISGAEAARLERLTPPTLSVIVANLERKGVVTRRPHPENARIQCLEATEVGRECLDRALLRVRGWEERVARAAPAGARDEIAAWLRRVAEIDV